MTTFDPDPNQPQPTSSVWPPPSTAMPPPNYPTAYLQAYRPLAGWARATVIFLIVSTVLDTISTLLDMRSPALMSTIISLASSGLYFITGIVFLIWTHRAYGNLLAIGTERTRYTPGWAVAYFFIPILSITRPVAVFSEMWNRTSGAPPKRKPGVPALIICWWLSYLVMGVFSWFVAMANQNNGGHPDIATNLADIAITVIVTSLAVLVVNRLTQRFEARYEEVRASAANPPVMWQ